MDLLWSVSSRSTAKRQGREMGQWEYENIDEDVGLGLQPKSTLRSGHASEWETYITEGPFLDDVPERWKAAVTREAVRTLEALCRKRGKRLK